ncbi:DUF2141 domain-containing protein [Kordiimonas sp. SCSIO 12610]|uniref:DUF2141 domain-containing protein n=1 Tax=Kordiimonas sp. SCSIO 12610 TaxID=2829597 RepID=UPI00210916EA|nr:DUF2141 domain-containing protein [Kordiimonas sp. SCSIO 12610]UTW55211.1 DUF2141 domain-containing protein [Kordiimonas sp. SCSIO 12610]
MQLITVLKCLLISFMFSLPVSAETGQQENNGLKIAINNVKAESGQLLLVVYNDMASFDAQDTKRAFASISVQANDKKQQIILSPVPNGKYAVALFHDANNNGVMDFKGEIPLEGYGTSGALRGLDQPSFNKAAVTVKDGMAHISVKLHYYR